MPNREFGHVSSLTQSTHRVWPEFLLLWDLAAFASNVWLKQYVPWLFSCVSLPVCKPPLSVEHGFRSLQIFTRHPRRHREGCWELPEWNLCLARLWPNISHLCMCGGTIIHNVTLNDSKKEIKLLMLLHSNFPNCYYCFLIFPCSWHILLFFLHCHTTPC